MNVAIIGSRSLNKTISIGFRPSKIISGGAIGIDKKAMQYAMDNNIPYEEYLPNYKRFGKIAPILRNKDIVDNCDMVIIYWDGYSRGTKMVIDYANKKNKKILLYNYDELKKAKTTGLEFNNTNAKL